MIKGLYSEQQSSIPKMYLALQKRSSNDIGINCVDANGKILPGGCLIFTYENRIAKNNLVLYHRYPGRLELCMEGRLILKS